MPFIFLIVCLLFSSCQSTSEWAVDQIKTDKEDSLRITHLTKDPVNGLDVMLLKLNNQSVIYLDVHGQGFIPDRIELKKVRVRLKTQEQTYHGYAQCHEGLQRIMLPDELKEILITLLEQKKTVIIEAGGYKETLKSEGFSLSKKFSFIPKLLSF